MTWSVNPQMRALRSKAARVQRGNGRPLCGHLRKEANALKLARHRGGAFLPSQTTSPQAPPADTAKCRNVRRRDSMHVPIPRAGRDGSKPVTEVAAVGKNAPRAADIR